MKKLVSLVLAMVLLFSLTGLAEYILPLTEEKVHFTIISPEHASTEDFNTNEQMLFIEQMTNIDIDVITFPMNDFQTKIDLLMAAGGDDIGDIIATTGTTGLDRDKVDAYGKAGYLIDVSDMLDSAYWLPIAYSYTDKTYEEAINDVRAANGAVYGAPFFYSGATGLETRECIEIYKPWMEAAGFATVPTNLEDYRTMLEYFRDNDMDGDGDPSNEIPATSYPASTTNTNIRAAFITPFLGHSGQVEYYEENGEIFFTYEQDGYREGLEYIIGLVQDNLLDPNSFTQDKASHDALVQIEPIYVGSYLRFYNCNANVDAKNQYVNAVALAKDADSVRYNAMNQYTAAQRWYITKNCQYPELAFALGDYLVSPEMYFMSVYGWEGQDWCYVRDYDGDKSGMYSPELDSGKFEGTIDDCVRTDLINRGNIYNHRLTGWGAAVAGLNAAEFYGKYIVKDTNSATWPYELQRMKALDPEGITICKSIKISTFSEEESEVLTEKWTAIKSYEEQMYAEFCTGKTELNDETWDAYIKTMYDMGLEEVKDTWNAAYTRMLG